MTAVVKFNIREGMTDDELINEIKGRVSGETSAQMVDFYHTADLVAAGFVSLPKFKVELVGESMVMEAKMNQYAVILKNILTQENGKPKLEQHYFIIGINDEGQYFIHSLRGFAQEQLTQVRKNFDKLMLWVNREDQGFTERLQGDLMVQYVDKTKLWEETSEGLNPLSCNEKPIKLTSTFTIPHIDIPDFGYGTISIGNHTCKLFQDPKKLGKLWKNEKQGIGRCWYVEVDAMNHYIVIDASKVLLEHAEHKPVTVQVPEDKYLIITNQRGRPGLLARGGGD